MPIILAPLNKEMKVVKLLGNDKTKKHLESLGISINSTLMVLQSTNGNVILKVKDSRLALDRSIASMIIVG